MTQRRGTSGLKRSWLRDKRESLPAMGDEEPICILKLNRHFFGPVPRTCITSKEICLHAYTATWIITLNRTKPKPQTAKQKKESIQSNCIYGYILSLQTRELEEGAGNCVIEAIKQDFELNENSVNPDNLNRRYQICLFTSVVLHCSVRNRIPTDVNVILAKRIIIILFIISPFKAPCKIT